MPSKKPRRTKLKQVLQTAAPVIPSPNELEDFIREANEVKALTQQGGWHILTRDLISLKDGLAKRLAYVSPKRPEHEEARIQFIAIDKLFALIDDYENNRNESIKLLDKLQNPDLAITMDIDNEIPSGRGSSENGL